MAEVGNAAREYFVRRTGNVYYCSKEIYDSINAGEKIEVVVTEEGSLDDYDNIRDVILEVEDSRPMIYDPDGLIYYLYHKPME